MRARSEGSVYQRKSDGLWAASLTLDGGRRVTRYSATQAEALRVLARLRAERDRGQQPTDERTTVKAFLERWLAAVEPRLRPSTFARYRQIVERQIIPNIGPLRLARLQPSDVAAMMTAVQAQGLSPRTAAHCRAVLRAALADAEKWGELSRNAAKLADPPHLPPPSPAVLSPEQARQMVEAIRDPQLHRLAVVALGSGLRQGELLGLRWPDVNFKRRTLSVRSSLTPVGGTYQLVEPKSATSRRVVPVTSQVIEALEAERKSQLETKLAAGGRWKQPIPQLVFTTDRGRPRNGPTVTHQFERELEAAGLPKLRWHDLRAAYGALLLSAGIDIAVVSKALGHSSLALTARHYAGVADHLGRQAADRLGRMLRPSLPRG